MCLFDVSLFPSFSRSILLLVLPIFSLHALRFHFFYHTLVSLLTRGVIEDPFFQIGTIFARGHGPPDATTGPFESNSLAIHKKGDKREREREREEWERKRTEENGDRSENRGEQNASRSGRMQGYWKKDVTGAMILPK